jgi:hypothetical protein
MRGAHRLPCRAYPDQRVFLDQGSFGKAGSADAHSIYMDDNRYVWVMDRTASKMVKYEVRLKPEHHVGFETPARNGWRGRKR